jgi:hypothetical protein
MFSHLAHWSLRAPVSPLDRDIRQRPVPAPSEREFLVGLSIGQGVQPSGVAVVERLVPTQESGSRSYTCRYLRRWPPPATAYPTLVADLTTMLRDTPLHGSDLVVEAGPGIKAVVAFLRKHRLPARIQPVEVKASADDDYVAGLWRVTKASVIETARGYSPASETPIEESCLPSLARPAR